MVFFYTPRDEVAEGRLIYVGRDKVRPANPGFEGGTHTYAPRLSKCTFVAPPARLQVENEELIKFGLPEVRPSRPTRSKSAIVAPSLHPPPRLRSETRKLFDAAASLSSPLPLGRTSGFTSTAFRQPTFMLDCDPGRPSTRACELLLFCVAVHPTWRKGFPRLRFPVYLPTGALCHALNSAPPPPWCSVPPELIEDCAQLVKAN